MRKMPPARGGAAHARIPPRGFLRSVGRTPDAKITNPQDALWWSFATITTVGYGDLFPVTTAGRITGAVLMTAGVGVFRTVTAAVGAWMLRPRDSLERTESEKR